MSDPVQITDLQCLAQFAEEQTDGTIATIQRVADLREIFHPLQDANDKAAATNFMVKMEDGSIKDLNELFEPVDNGKECAIPTDLTVNGVDLQQIFAGINTLPVDLQLQQLPAGVFDCTTRVKIHYDKSGSMNTAFGYITPAINTLKSWFSKTYNFDQAGYGSIYVEDPADPFEQSLTWISEDGGAATHETEIHIAYINGSRDTGSADGYVSKWIAAQAAGGSRSVSYTHLTLPTKA